MRGRRIHFIDTDPSSRSPALLVVPGWLGSTVSFLPFVACAAKRQRVVVLDLPGFGCSEANPEWSTPAGFAEILHTFARGRVRRRFTLVGSSMGAAIAVRYVREHPGRVQHLVLCSPHGLAMQQGVVLRMLRRPLLAASAIRLVRRAGVKAILRFLVAEPRCLVPRIVDAYWKPFGSAAGRRALVLMATRVLCRLEIEDELARLDVPTLVLFGAADPLNQPACRERFRRLLPQARFIVVRRCGHLLSLERPAALDRALQQFVEARR